LLVHEVSNHTECHEEGEHGDDGGGEKFWERSLVATLGSHVQNGSISFENEHCDANVTKDTTQVEHFDLAFDHVAVLNFVSKVPKDKRHSKGSNDDAHGDEVRQEGVRSNERYCQSGNGQEADIKVLVLAEAVQALVVTRIIANYGVYLFRNEVQVTNACAQLHYPN